jgi:hypothetical protein
VLGRIESSTAQLLQTERVPFFAPPFLAGFHPSSPVIWLNFATTIAPTEPLAEDAIVLALQRLHAEFRRRGLRLRFEILEPLHPTIGPILDRYGLALQGRMPTMICTPEDLQAQAGSRSASLGKETGVQLRLFY